MGRQKGSKNKTEVTLKKDGVISSVNVSSAKEEKPETLSAEQELQKDQAEQLEAEALKKKMEKEASLDKVTIYLEKHFGLKGIQFKEDYFETRLPHLLNGEGVRVKRYYPSLNLCVDRIPKGTVKDDILSKKWEFERIGKKYTWIQEGENLEFDEKDEKNEFLNRLIPLNVEPKQRIHFLVPKTTVWGNQSARVV